MSKALCCVRKSGQIQRNHGIKWLNTKYGNMKDVDGVVYFADDDYIYDIRLFNNYIRNVKSVGVWPAAFVGGAIVEIPFVTNGTFIGWNVRFNPKRKFATDMAGFAVNLEIFLKNEDDFSDIGCGWNHGHCCLESCFLEKLNITLEQLQPFGYKEGNKILVSGGEILDSNKPVSSCNFTGSDSNPFFLISRCLENVKLDAQELESSLISLRDDIQLCFNQTPSFELLQRYSEIAKKFAWLSERAVNIYHRLVQDQHWLHQGWLALVSNLESVNQLGRRTDRFKVSFDRVIGHKENAKELLKCFPKDLELLAQNGLVLIVEPEVLHTKYGSMKDVDGVVYFADDDNIYDIRLFNNYIRNVQSVGIWPAAFVNGTIIGWNVSKFATDMAGFAVNQFGNIFKEQS